MLYACCMSKRTTHPPPIARQQLMSECVSRGQLWEGVMDVVCMSGSVSRLTQLCWPSGAWEPPSFVHCPPLGDGAARCFQLPRRDAGHEVPEEVRAAPELCRCPEGLHQRGVRRLTNWALLLFWSLSSAVGQLSECWLILSM